MTMEKIGTLPTSEPATLKKGKDSMNEMTTTPSETDLVEMGRIFAASGMFPEHRDAAQCATKLIVGRGLGLSAYDAMNGLHIIQGKPVVASNTMAAAIKRSGRYDYRATTTDEECEITFFDLGQRDENGKPSTIGTTRFTMDDAKRAGLNGQNWKKYPRAMLFARAISAGYREHCPDALGISPVYVEAHGESEIPRPLAAEVIEQPPAQAAADRLDELESLLRSNPDGEDIKTRAMKKAGVGSLSDLDHNQTERMIEWLTK
jgi:hypothetical protein